MTNKERKAEDRARRKHYKGLAKRFGRRYAAALQATEPKGPSRVIHLFHFRKAEGR